MRATVIASLVALAPWHRRPSGAGGCDAEARRGPRRPRRGSSAASSWTWMAATSPTRSRSTTPREDPWLAETAKWTADYGVKVGPTFGASGGVRVWRQLVARVGYSTFSDTNAAAIVGTVPHPFFFNKDRSISGSEEGLKQQENVIDVGAMWLIPVSRHVDVRVFGGPSFFQLKRDLVQDVTYRDAYPYDVAEFSSVTRTQLKDDTIGFHVGADVTY